MRKKRLVLIIETIFIYKIWFYLRNGLSEWARQLLPNTLFFLFNYAFIYVFCTLLWFICYFWTFSVLLEKVILQNTSYELQVACYELLVATWKLKSTSWIAKVWVQIHELGGQLYELQVQIHELRVQIYKLQVQTYVFGVQIHESQVQIHEFKNH